MRFKLEDVERDALIDFSGKKRAKKKKTTRRSFERDEVPFSRRDFTQCDEYFHEDDKK